MPSSLNLFIELIKLEILSLPKFRKRNDLDESNKLGKRLSSSRIKKILSKPNDIPKPLNLGLISWTKLSYLPPPPIEPILNSVGAETSTIVPV